MWLDLVKSELLEHVMKGGFKDNWAEFWRPEFEPLISGDGTDLELLSESLRDIFLSASKAKGRSPEQAGLQWRRFIWCILSMLSTNDSELPVLGRPMSNNVLPEWVRDKLRITIGEERGLSHDPDLIMLRIKKPTVDLAKGAIIDSDYLRSRIDSNPDCVENILVIWTKTNFNDLIQQPMLWARIDMLHQMDSGPLVRHAWATVPSQKPELFSPGTAPFNRAATFNGGAYWGLGRRESFGMRGIFDILPDWEGRITELRKIIPDSLLFKELGLRD